MPFVVHLLLELVGVPGGGWELCVCGGWGGGGGGGEMRGSAGMVGGTGTNESQ